VITHTITEMATVLEREGAGSFLDRPLDHWLDMALTLNRGDITRTIALLRYDYEHLSDIGGIDVDAEYATDVWQASRLGIVRTRSPHRIRFDEISQPWLRAAMKRWARLRLGSGKTFDTVLVDARAVAWFSRYLTTVAGGGATPAAVTSELLEGYLVSITASRPPTTTAAAATLHHRVRNGATREPNQPRPAPRAQPPSTRGRCH
jgi:hypothetical protein